MMIITKQNNFKRTPKSTKQMNIANEEKLNNTIERPQIQRIPHKKFTE